MVGQVGARSKERVFLFTGTFKTYANHQLSRSGEGHRWSLCPQARVTNLPIFAMEKTAQGQRRMFNLKYSMKSYKV
jgi:hypothetical protein